MAFGKRRAWQLKPIKIAEPEDKYNYQKYLGRAGQILLFIFQKNRLQTIGSDFTGEH